MSKKPGQKIVKCSFCGRDGNEVGSMIAGPYPINRRRKE